MYTLPIGTKITSPTTTYTITGVLGQGGFGITYSATFMFTVGTMKVKGNVALKEHFVKADCVRDRDTSRVSCSDPARSRVELTRKDFIGEARRLRKISGQHPNIVTVNEVFEANNTAYYAMEMLEGESLREYVASRGKLTERETLAIMTPIVEAVAFLHRNRITHLDIKPHNIMIATDDEGKMRPVLIDFGLSKHYDESGDATSTINSRGFSDGYAPIEQYTGITTFSPASDVYSLAATMVFCLTGQRLPAANKVTAGVLEETLPHSLTSTLRRTLVRALSMQDDKRHADASVLLYALIADETHKAKQPAEEATVLDVQTKTNPDESTVLDTLPTAHTYNAFPNATAVADVPKAEFKGSIKKNNVSSPPHKGTKKTVIAIGIFLVGCTVVYLNWYPNVVAPLIYDYVSSECSEGLWVIEKEEKYGFIDKSGKEVIPLIYADVCSFREGLAAVNKGGKWGYINKLGDMVIPMIYDNAPMFREGLANVSKDGKYGYINQSGDEVIPLIYDENFDFDSDGLARVTKDGKFGFLNKSGNVVIPLIYTWTDTFNEGLCNVQKDGKYGFINQSGEIVIPLIYDDAWRFSEGTAKVKKDGEIFTIDKLGNRVD